LLVDQLSQAFAKNGMVVNDQYLAGFWGDCLFGGRFGFHRIFHKTKISVVPEYSRDGDF
jgi:hypothetical protein